MEKYFFDIPVFRCSLEEWGKERSAENLKLAKQIKRTEDVTAKDIKNAEDWNRGSFSSYRYSDLVGIIRLYAMPGQIRAETFFVTNKRLVRNQKNKRWSYLGKLLEFMVFPEMTNGEIYDWTLKKIKRVSKEESYLKKRFVEIECFETTGPFIDYKKLTGLK